jgi:hypothetical protein
MHSIIQQLSRQRAKIDAALAALEELTEDTKTGSATTEPFANGTGKKRRTMSAAARKAIGDAQRKRWARQKQRSSSPRKYFV